MPISVGMESQERRNEWTEHAGLMALGADLGTLRVAAWCPRSCGTEPETETKGYPGLLKTQTTLPEVPLCAWHVAERFSCRRRPETGRDVASPETTKPQACRVDLKRWLAPESKPKHLCGFMVEATHEANYALE